MTVLHRHRAWRAPVHSAFRSVRKGAQETKVIRGRRERAKPEPRRVQAQAVPLSDRADRMNWAGGNGCFVRELYRADHHRGEPGQVRLNL